MPRRPTVRVATATLPPKDHFTSHLAPLLATREHRVSPSAAHLWSVLRAHAWRDGRCDLSDRELAAWMGGLGLRHIFNLRTELAAAGLVETTRTPDGVRWLTPLPPEEGEDRNSGNVFPEIHFMETRPLKEEEVNINTIPPPPPLPPPPPGDFTGNGLPAHAALARFLVAHGAFPGVAAALAEVLLARMSRGEAEVYSLALLKAAEDSGDVRSGRIDEERVTGRWIARARSGVQPPAWAVEEARKTLAPAMHSLAVREGVPVSTRNDAAEDEQASRGGPASNEAEERPWIVSGGRACSHRELWEMVLSHLRLQLPAGTFAGWLQGTTCTGTGASDRTLVVQVRDQCAVDWLTLRLRRKVLRTLEAITGLDDVDVWFEEG